MVVIAIDERATAWHLERIRADAELFQAQPWAPIFDNSLPLLQVGACKQPETSVRWRDEAVVAEAESVGSENSGSIARELLLARVRAHTLRLSRRLLHLVHEAATTRIARWLRAPELTRRQAMSETRRATFRDVV